MSDYYDQGGGKSESASLMLASYFKNRSSLGRVLDVGCGNGALLTAVKEKSASLFGIDVSSAAIQSTRERIPEATVDLGDLQAGLPFASGFFDTVFLCDVIEHLVRPVDALQELFRVTAGGGTIMITTPNANSPVRLITGQRWFGLSDPGHLMFYTRFSLTHLLRKIGFSIEQAKNEGLTGTPFDPLLRLSGIGGTIVVIVTKP